MEIFVKFLQGSYAYLLIGQILLVSGLMLALIWLIIRRTQEAAALNGPPEAIGLQPAPEAAPVVAGIPEAQHEELKSRLNALQSEYDALKASYNDSQALREKVKYLESRLLEYEILQEEIGTLSQLKLENEHLKEELVNLQSGKSPARPEAVSAPLPPTPTISPDPPAPAMGSYAESMLPKAPAPMPPAPAPTPEPDLVKAVLVTPSLGLIPEADAVQTDKEALAQGESAAAGLESLLDQIDKLTASSND